MFITFEGIEGCGKTTQIKRLGEKMGAYGIPHVTTLEPGGTKIGERIRRILLDAKNRNLSSLTELLLYIADRSQHVEEVIKPALEQGRWVMCDRFFDATVAYQGAARGQDLKLVRDLNNIATQGIRPDITFLLDCPVEVGLERALRRNETDPEQGQDRFEKEKINFHIKVREAYLELAEKHKKRFVVIDATLSMDDMEEEIFKYIRPFIYQKK